MSDGQSGRKVGQRASKERDLPRARRLYTEERMSLSEIARQTGIARNSLIAWRRWDKKTNGIDWEELRDAKLAEDPIAPLAVLKWRYQELIKRRGRDMNFGSFEDKLNKLGLEIDRLGARLGDPDRILDTMKLIAHWGRQRLGDAKLMVLREVMVGLRDDLRSGMFQRTVDEFLLRSPEEVSV